ncbi:MAG: hypothetical protein C1943_09155 [Halochromatium sp.]|nr:hypothetical protein [Halochromatium sp.]
MVGETPKKAQIRTVRATGYGSIGEGQAKRGDLTRVKQGSNASLEAAFALIQRPPDEPISVINRTMSLTA